MLKDIKTNKCPICGCTDIISESVETTALGEIHTHCNGTRWEHRRFLCGNSNLIANGRKGIYEKYI